MGKFPDWTVWSKTVIIQKDLSNGTIPSNYRPITCLPNIWKLLTRIISDKKYESLGERVTSTKEQKGRKNAAQGTNDLVFIKRSNFFYKQSISNPHPGNYLSFSKKLTPIV